MELDKLIEVWSTQLNGLWYEVHVDATEQRIITDVFCEVGGRNISDKVIDDLQKEVDKIEII